MSSKTQMLCASCGLVGISLGFVGIASAGMLPPIGADWSAERVAAFYADHTTGIRVGMMLIMFAGAFTIPFVAVITNQMRRVEGSDPVLSYAQLAFGTLNGIGFLIWPFMMMVASFRPERDPQLIQLLHDLGWLPFIVMLAPTTFMFLVIGLCAFRDASERILPRWVGYVNIWAAMLTLPGLFIPFFKSGPFAWNGAFSFWVPLTVFGIWYVLMFFVLRRAIINQQIDEPVGTRSSIPIPA